MTAGWRGDAPGCTIPIARSTMKMVDVILKIDQAGIEEKAAQ